MGPPWEGNCLSAEKVLHVLWSPKFHYRVRKTVATIQFEMNPIHTFPHYFFTINSDVILPSTIFYLPCGLWCVRRRNCSVFCVLASAETVDGQNTTRILYVAYLCLIIRFERCRQSLVLTVYKVYKQKCLLCRDPWMKHKVVKSKGEHRSIRLSRPVLLATVDGYSIKIPSGWPWDFPICFL